MRSSQIFLVPALIGSLGVAQAAKGPESIHKVKSGETAARIAKMNGMSLSRLASLNPKINLSKLSVGMSLRVVESSHRSSDNLETNDSVAPADSQPESANTKSLAPMLPLPAIPSTAPSTLIHLERVLPNSLNKSISSVHPQSHATLSSQATSSPLTFLQPVFLPSSGMEYESVVAANLGFEPADPNHLNLLWPVETRTVSSAWGPRIRTRTMRIVKASVKKRIRVRYHSSHKGVDLTAPVGTDVYAAMDGRVILTGKHRQYGNFVLIEHGNGIQTMYSHHRINFARTGDIVQRGQKIAEVGRTGNATGPHLHFELRLQGQPQNPIPYLDDIEEIPSELVAFNNAASPSNHKR